MATGLTANGYRKLVDDVRACVQAHVPPGAVVLIASKGDEELVRIDGYRAWHFPRDEWGSYAGHHPASSVEALAHLRRLYAQGARYLVFPATASWWLEYYRELAELLASAHVMTVLVEGVCVIYELRESAAFDAFISTAATDDDLLLGRARATAPLISLTRSEQGAPLRILSILARFGTEQWGSAEERIADVFARQMPRIERRSVVVDNALPRGFVEHRDGATLIGGDNSSREFSAFDRAVEFVGSDIWSYDFVHIATSAFSALYVAYLERFDATVLQALAGRPACVGHIDCYNEPVAVQAYRSQHWIRSCFFFLPPTEVMALGSFVSVADGDRIFSGNPDAPFRPDAPVSSRYRDYIVQWLTGNGVGQGVEWHSRFALDGDTLPRFEQKARTILNEHLLSIRLQALGCHLIDVTWLSGMLRRHPASDIALTTSWREQLANRDRDRLVLTGSSPAAVRAAV